MNQKLLAILNALSVVLVLWVNYYSQLHGINGNQVGELSNRYDNLFTPASYAFAIWGIIFLLLIFLVSYQLFMTFYRDKAPEEFIKMSGWFTLANLGNATWVIVWLYEWTFLSVMVMAIILVSLLKVVINLNMERYDAPFSVIAFIWWPICLYAGWISVAIIANMAAYLSKMGWEGGFLSEQGWTIVMIIIATAINGYMIFARNMREFAVVGVWALYAISFRQEGINPSISWVALFGTVLLTIFIGVHGYKNRKYNPIYKLFFH